ncbi:hypothetical protein M9980_05935 [Sphingomonas donggukensis]|uniref:Uncharacterized protein n=1 Tax=Sphingomonas donggukensis TaxID=2949093 RepID=A0ABY4TWM3_9SPHN|nr:hypothetical protein [Sphingomonas donggukensis]URW76743.1 hypothetical protein M9980_05935 [Sphingomonas donggukensis]
MSGGQWMVVMIVLIASFSGIIKAKMGIGRRRDRRDYGVADDAAATAENYRLKSEISNLKERIQVLERVVTDTEGSVRLDREIEKLRDARHD